MVGRPIGPCKALSTLNYWLFRRFELRYGRGRGCVPVILRIAKVKGIHATLKTTLLFSLIRKGNPDLVGTINRHEIAFQKKRDVPRIESVSHIYGQLLPVGSI